MILSLFNWPFLEDTANLTSVASQEAYELPINLRNNQVTAVRFEQSSSLVYRPKPVQSPQFWEYLQSLATSDSDVTEYYYVQENQLLLYPKPATASKTIRVRFKKIATDMTREDYTTGTISDLTNGDDDVTGGSTTWTAGMVGMYLRITKASAAGAGDGFWYEIESRSANTAIVLVKNYAGTTLAAASAAYTIGELPLIPEPYHNLLVWRPQMVYYMQNAEDMGRAQRFAMIYDGGHEMGIAPQTGGLLKRMMDAYSGTQEGMYLEPLDISEPTPGMVNLTNHDWIGEGW